MKRQRKTGLVCLATVVPAAAMLCTACAMNAQKQELPTIRMYTVGSSSDAACERIGEALSALTAEHLGFAVEITQTSTAGYDNTLSRALLQGEDIDLFCYTDMENIFSLVSDGKAAALNDWLDEFPVLRDTVPDDYWACMTYNGQIVGVPGNNPNSYAIGFEVRADIMAALGVSAADIHTMEDMGELLRLAKAEFPDITPLVPHFGQPLQALDIDPLNNGLGVLLGNTGTEVVDLYSTDYFADLCEQMHTWYQEGLMLADAPLTNIPNTRALALYDGFSLSQRVSRRNIISVNRSSGVPLETIVLGPRIQNTATLNICWCINAQSSTQDQRRALQLLEFLYTDHEAADLLLYGMEGIDYRRLDAQTVTTIDPKPKEEWNTIHWGQPNSEIVSEWIWADGRKVAYTEPRGTKISPAYGFTYTPSAELRPIVSNCLQIVGKYENALLSGYLDPEETLPLFQAELQEAGISTIVADKQAQLDAWLAQNGNSQAVMSESPAGKS